MPTLQPVYLISSCLLGLCTRYDAKIKNYPDIPSKFHDAILIPICPEQLGGLATPRVAADLTGGDGNDVLNSRASVVTKSGIDVTTAFIQGAEQVLKIAQMQKISKAILKARSPSCGVTGNIGVTAALLQKHNIEIVEID
ncbi:MAG: hypothetical protein COA36_10075 [Desulfotalea sp.]|nr:MAG: hypothetical protein COA36_10075 [Desulfotalea sp.]